MHNSFSKIPVHHDPVGYTPLFMGDSWMSHSSCRVPELFGLSEYHLYHGLQLMEHKSHCCFATDFSYRVACYTHCKIGKYLRTSPVFGWDGLGVKLSGNYSRARAGDCVRVLLPRLFLSNCASLSHSHQLQSEWSCGSYFGNQIKDDATVHMLKLMSPLSSSLGPDKALCVSSQPGIPATSDTIPTIFASQL